MDQKKRSSEVSDTFKFTLVAQASTQEMILDIDSTQLHGRVAEIIRAHRAGCRGDRKTPQPRLNICSGR